MNDNRRFAIILAMEQKKIVHWQLKMIKWLRNMVRVAHREVKELVDAGADEHTIDATYRTIYLAHAPYERDQLDAKGRFRNEQDEHWYQYRRFFIREYLA